MDFQGAPLNKPLFAILDSAKVWSLVRMNAVMSISHADLETVHGLIDFIRSGASEEEIFSELEHIVSAPSET
jgi:hypothetical protein